MRKNTARKWVHLLLDLLPVLIIPIFAIFLINHEPQGLQVETGGWEVQEKYQTNEVDTISDLIVGHIYKFNFENLDPFYIVQEGYIAFTLQTPLEFQYNTITSETNSIEFESFTNFLLCIWDDGRDIYLDVYYSTEQYEGLEATSSYVITNITFTNNFYAVINDLDGGVSPNNYEISDFNVYNYTYNEGMVYANTDIGSQLIYSMYIPVHDYFNMTNLFNFGDIYTWINNSLFSGNAPLPIFIVYNVIVYEFLIDLIFLIYSIFMFIIDFSSELLARCFSFSNKGGTR